MKIKFYDQALDSDLKYAVICAKIGERWLLCRHRERQTWELPGGSRKPGESIHAAAARKLRETGLDQFVRSQAASGKPLLGICLGMQLLFETSFEYGEHPGLGLLKGQVVPMAGRIPQGLKIPHMGWNRLEWTGGSLLKCSHGEYVYFVHSYFAQGCEDSLAAVTEYGIPITAAVEKDNVFGCQFHPEKSGSAGLAILDRFCRV